ncbi:DMT family transporter [Pseudalkalibacillus caeni]|uniref:DMT family transporter n=1 Tax=Exobacillus caeni TaxID=2574798 RepID=UPI0014853A8A|nr:DMT family transporter [Pseudalkalibacillus caeni]
MRKVISSPYLLLVLAALFWGGNFSVGKALVSVMPPVTMSTIRWSVSFLLFLPLAYRDVSNNKETLRRNWKAVLGLAVTGIAMFNALAYLSMEYTTSINASLMNAMAPVVIVVLSVIYLKDRFNAVQLSGILLSIAGVIWIITRGDISRIIHFSFNPGDLIMVVAVSAWGAYSVMMKKFGGRLPGRGTFLLTMLVGIICLLPFTVYELITLESPLVLEPLNYLQLAYISVFPSVLAFLCWNKGLLAVGPSKASVYLNLIVVFVALFGIIFLDERLYSFQIIGGILVVAGVYLSNRAGMKKASVSRRGIKRASHL